MYCSKCGKHNPDNISYCQYCGATIGSEKQVKTKSEYFKEYHSKHPGYYVLCVLSIIFEIIGAIVIIAKIANTRTFYGYMPKSQKEELLAAIFIGVILGIIGSIFLIIAKGMDKTAGEEYERYLKGQISSSQNIAYTPIENGNRFCPKCGVANAPANNYCSNCSTRLNAAATSSEGEWKCPSCGRINQNYVGTCGCGEVKPK